MRVLPVMVLLKSLECSQCQDRLYPYYTTGKEPVLVRGCSYCGGLFCGKCVQTGINRRCSDQQRQSYFGDATCRLQDSSPHYAAAIAYFDKFAPADEMKRLSLRRWSPSFCRFCSRTSCMKVGENGFLFCPRCDLQYAPRNRHRLTDFLRTRILLELNDLFLPDRRKAVIAQDVKLQRQECCECRTTITTDDITASDDGRLRCRECRKRKCYDFHSVECMFYFFAFLNHIPDMDDLSVLTYSKWTPLKCEKCSVVFSEIEDRMPMLNTELHKIVCQKCSEQGNTSATRQTFIKLHFLVDIIKEFREYFKNKGADCLTSQRLEPTTFPNRLPEINDMNMELSSVASKATTKEPSTSAAARTARAVADVSNKDQAPVTPLTTHRDSYFEKTLLRVALLPEEDRIIPDTLRCQCGRYEELTEMKNCTTCNQNALCPKCTIKSHWGHQITDTMPELFVEVVNNESDKIKDTLGKWLVRLENTNVKGKEVFGRLVAAYETLFLKSLNSRDPTELHNLIIHNDFSKVEELLLETMTSNYKAFEKIKEFCEDLEELAPTLTGRCMPGGT